MDEIAGVTSAAANEHDQRAAFDEWRHECRHDLWFETVGLAALDKPLERVDRHAGGGISRVTVDQRSAVTSLLRSAIRLRMTLKYQYL